MMQWLLQGELRQVISIDSFRSLYGLSSEFGIEAFIQKDKSGVGSVENAGAPLQAVRHELIAAIPPQTPPGGWMAFIFTLQRLFRQQLNAVNDDIGLQASEIDYAVTGCCDILQIFVYEIGCAQLQGKPLPSFHEVYLNWFNSNIHLSRPLAHYAYGDYLWQIQIISNPFGRAGLAIQTHDATHYVYDMVLACPAAGWASALLRDLADAILRATSNKGKVGYMYEHSTQ